jgi:uncharacterized RDD family membrane protein YckC
MSQPPYILVIKGKPEGPFSIDELKIHGIKPGDFVKTEAMDDYKEAREIAELRELFGFSKPLAIPQYFAGFDQRLMASVLDWFFVSGVCILIAFVAMLFVSEKETRMIVAFSLLAIIPVLKLIYHIIMESTARQGTYGKQILHIKVCDMQGNQISFGRSLWRNLAKIFPVMTFFVGYLFSFFNKQQQCLHDMMAETLVMKDRLF